MRNYCRITLFVFSFLFLTGCQLFQADSLFKLQPSDSTITAAVNQAFLNNKLLASLPIQVETANGTVYLSGYVKTIRQSDTAGDLAEKIEGVKSVQNDIIVRK